VTETAEYVYEKLGWAASLMNTGIIHLFGRYFIINIIVAFMKKDVTRAIEKNKYNMARE
jgi:hypothetical protein